MTTQDDKLNKPLGNHDQPVSLGRRMLLRRGVIAMPAILTLHSGAALARSSNLISASPFETDANDNVWCMGTSTATADSPLPTGAYDFGDSGHTTVDVFPNTDYVSGTGQSKVTMTADQFCASGGSADYHLAGGGAPKTVTLQSPGIVVSSNAYNSLSPRLSIDFKDWTV